MADPTDTERLDVLDSIGPDLGYHEFTGPDGIEDAWWGVFDPDIADYNPTAPSLRELADAIIRERREADDG